MKYDAVISLGTFCQVGGALWVYGMKNINSPLDNFGIKRWKSVAEILETRFKDYWKLENMGTGKAVLENSGQHPGEQKMMLKAYCNKYNMVSNHNFLEDENPNGDLKTFPIFREKLKFLEETFLTQCKEYESIRFIFKIMDWPNPEETEVSPEDLNHLMEVLSELREGKAFDISISVPVKQFESVQAWIVQSKWDNIFLSTWELDFNNERSPEWDAMFKDVELDEDYYWQLISRIIGNTDINLLDVNNF